MILKNEILKLCKLINVEAGKIESLNSDEFDKIDFKLSESEYETIEIAISYLEDFTGWNQ